MSIIEELRKDPYINRRSLAMLYVFQSPQKKVLELMEDAGIDVSSGLDHVVSKMNEIPVETRNSIIMEAAKSNQSLGATFGKYLIEKMDQYVLSNK